MFKSMGESNIGHGKYGEVEMFQDRYSPAGTHTSPGPFRSPFRRAEDLWMAGKHGLQTSIPEEWQ